MGISNEMKKKVDQFAKEQAQFYLDDAELSYIEKLRKKGSITKGKITAKLAKFKSSSDRSNEAQGDMILYMSDYMNDLISQGLSEQEAFDKARQQLAFDSRSSQAADLQEKYKKYYEQLSPGVYEAIGMYYAAFSIFGIVVGALAGSLLGLYIFSVPLWISIALSTAAGFFLGIATAMLMHASVVRSINR